MIPEEPTSITLDALDKSNLALANPAVGRCCNAWKKAYRAKCEEDGYDLFAARTANEAFRAAMPPLTSRDNCRNFIACVAQGMLLGAIAEKNASKLLYAAQVALSSIPKDEGPQGPAMLRGRLSDFEPE